MSHTLLTKPRHIAIIMDGNNRWAKQRSLPSIAGHRAGVKSVRAVVEQCVKEDIKVLTLFAFSSENWQRPELEIRGLMALFLKVLQHEIKKLHENNVRLLIIGDRARFSESLQQHMQQAESLTQHNTGLVLVVAANYGGQWDIAQAAQKIARAAVDKEIAIDQIDAQFFQHYVCLADLPAVDLCIRTSGEQRISNFLLWQVAYAELYFTSLYWPDFRQAQLQEAIEEYANRQRRFGGR